MTGIANSLTLTFNGLDDMQIERVKDIVATIIQADNKDDYAAMLQRDLDRANKERSEAFNQVHAMDVGFRWMRTMLGDILKSGRLGANLTPDGEKLLAGIDALIKKRDTDEIPF